MVRILIADDHAIVRRGLRQILGEEPDLAVIGEARDADELLALIRKERPDLVLLDISMPGRSGLQILKELKEERPALPVLVLSMHPEDQYAVRAIKAGASGYLTKESAPEELVKAIRRVVTSGRYISPSLAERLAVDLAADTNRPPHEALSNREYQVMCALASGKCVSEIAAEISLSVKTVSTYRTRILQKMTLMNNAALTSYAVQHRLLGPLAAVPSPLALPEKSVAADSGTGALRRRTGRDKLINQGALATSA